MVSQEKHKHHIVPRHAGGTDDPSNLIEVSREVHAGLHYELYLKHNKKEDLCAYYMLTGDMENFRSIYSSLGGRATQRIRKQFGLDCFGQGKESHAYNASAGGLIQGKRNTESGHIQRVQKLSDCSIAGKKGSTKCRELGVSAFFDSKLRKHISRLGGKVQGKVNALSGHLKRISALSSRSSGRKWITNSIDNRMILPNEIIPSGFYYGKTQRKTN